MTSSSAEQLAMKIGPSTRYGISGARIAINHVQRVEPRFSSTVLELFDAMGTDHVFARDRIVRGLSDGMKDTEAVLRIFDESLLNYSTYMLEPVLKEIGTAPGFDWCFNVAHRIARERPELRIDVFENDLTTLSRHYHPLMFAIYWMSRCDGAEIAPFVLWAGQQDDLEGTIALAWEKRSIDVRTLQELVDLKSGTHGSLQSGVI